MAVIVKCHHRPLPPDDLLNIDDVWIFENCAPEQDEEIFVCWHNNRNRAACLAIRGTLLRFDPRERRNHLPKASLQIHVAEQIENGPTLSTLYVTYPNLSRKLHVAGWTKVACLDDFQEIAHLRTFFHDGRSTDDIEAVEGYGQDQTRRFLHRNADLIARRKEYDGYQCQACHFRLEVHRRFIIDCHHKCPLTDVRVTSWPDDLICLCPRCHRIAHTRKSPLTVEEIQTVLQEAGLL
jgi:hypothetical protein